MPQRFIVQPGGPGAQRLPYLLALPQDAGPHTPLWVCVHGLTRQALSHARAFHRPAQAAGAALLVPLFSVEKHRRYQQLAHPGSGRRADLALLQAVKRVRRRHGLAGSPLYLFGYSAGAQFAHRFAMAHPRQVAALAVGAAGWYTWPDDQLPYPLGWAGMGEHLGLPVLDRAAFLALPKAVWVGEHDDRADPALRSTPELDALQGTHRLERAQRWAAAVSAASRQQRPSGQRHSLQEAQQLQGPQASQVPVFTVARSGHDFVACAQRGQLAWQVAAFFEACRQAATWQQAAAAAPSAWAGPAAKTFHDKLMY